MPEAVATTSTPAPSPAAAAILAAAKTPAPEPTAAPAQADAPATPTSTEQAPPPEAKPEGTPPASTPEPDSARFAALAKKEAALVRRQEAAKAELARERAAVESERQRLQNLASLSELAKSDPLKALESLGLSYESLTEHVLKTAGEPEPVKKEDLAALEKRLRDERTAELQKEQKAAYQRAIQQFHEDVESFVKTNSDTYELINARGAATLVVEVIEGHFNQTGKLLSNEEAAQLVEAHLEEEALRLAATKKVSAKLNPQAPATEKKPEVAPPRTLSNSLGATSASLASDVSSEEARRANAIATLERMTKKQ